MGLANSVRALDMCDRLHAPLRVRRAAARARADPRAVPPARKDPGHRRDQQLPRRDVQLYDHVQLPDLVPDRAAHERERRW